MIRLVSSVLALWFLVTVALAQETLRIDITQGKVEALPIAIPAFAGGTEEEAEIGALLASIITADLERSGLFAPIDPQAFVQTIADINVQPRFANWRVINAQALVQGGLSVEEDGNVRVVFRLWDVFSAQQMLGQVLTSGQGNLRRIAHIIADKIYERLTGEQGYFDTRIVYIAESGPKQQRIKRLAIMDQDGGNHKFLTDGASLVLTPRFSPVEQKITYLSYFRSTPRVYLLDLDSGRREILGNFKGMTFAPRFSADGSKVVMSHAEGGQSDIYVMDLATRGVLRLTNTPSIDTSPSYSSDGREIVFNSDRGGTPQLYIMDADGSNVRRISFGRGSFTTPVWSPRGDWIAFTWQRKGKFHIGVMRPDGSGKRILTESFLDEAPTWAPNGRVIMFFRQFPGAQGKVRLYSIDLTGYNLREILTPGDASDPVWSPPPR